MFFDWANSVFTACRVDSLAEENVVYAIFFFVSRGGFLLASPHGPGGGLQPRFQACAT